MVAVDLKPKTVPVTERAASPSRFLAGALAGPRSPRARVGALTALAIGGVAAITGGGFGISAWSAYSSRTNAPSDQAYFAAQSSMQSRATVTNVAFTVAGVALVTSVVLWLKGDSLFHEPLALTAAQAR